MASSASRHEYHNSTGVIVSSRRHSSAFLRDWFSPSLKAGQDKVHIQELKWHGAHILRKTCDVAWPTKFVNKALKPIFTGITATSTCEHVGCKENLGVEVGDNPKVDVMHEVKSGVR